ncbi:putative bifunctional diguanylate cyclase/phosphodiesterase [Actinoplanes sp. CA-015351]|uniref:putative bifunctional diguanylate cyclase/phosphodiesterase n=1 Tax=Actinoplanes sp. CA-015351 TaxID=3239897 RepID=UPI003D976204
MTKVFYGVLGTALAAVLGALLFAGVDAQQAAGPVLIAFDLVSMTFAVLTSRRRDLHRGTRRGWRWIAAAMGTLVIASVCFAVFKHWSMFPAPGDVVRLAFVPVMLTGLLTLQRRGGGGRSQHKTLLDVGTVVAGGAMVMWYFAVGPLLDDGRSSGAAVLGALAYPIGDLVLLFGVALVLTQGADPSVRRPLRLIAVALLFEISGNLYLGFLRAHDQLQGSTPASWQFACWLVGHALIAASAFEQFRTARGEQPVTGTDRERVVNRLPYLSVGLALALLTGAALRAGKPSWIGLVLGSVALTGFVVARQIVALRENHEMAVTDGLTGLANRSRLGDALGRALARSSRNGRAVGVLLADLNGFKEVNDTLGHAAGDRMLVEFAGMLRRSVLGSDVVGRLGGDEFAVVLQDIGSRANAEAVVRRLLREMELPIMIDDVVVRIQAAVGIAVAEPGAMDADALLRRADEAMYENKRRIKSGVPGGTEEEEDLAAGLWGAAERGELRVHYQPVVDLPTGEINGMEALVRWQHPERGTIPPGVFIPIAERTGAIEEIGAWVLAEACAQVARWRAGGRRLHLGVNASPRQLTDGFADQVIRTLTATGLPATELIIEVTESVQVENPTVVAELHRLHGHGVRIALDDFGTGYSTLRYLTQLPIDILKIDQSFVAVLNGTANGAVVTDTVLRLGRMMNLSTIAEGVESAEQATELVELGCRSAQGYHFARPMPAAELEALLYPAEVSSAASS